MADIEAATLFYSRALGGELRLTGRVLGCDYRVLRLGGTRLFLFTKAPYEDRLEEPLPLGFLHVVFELAIFLFSCFPTIAFP